jgi:hypothetical protein
MYDEMGEEKKKPFLAHFHLEEEIKHLLISFLFFQ